MIKYLLVAIFFSVNFVGLKAQTKSSLMIITEENNFDVYIDNVKQEPIKEEDYIIIKNISLGKHSISFRKKHYDTVIKSIRFQSTEMKSYELEKLSMSKNFTLEVVNVKGGSFVMGDNIFGHITKPHSVSLPDFKMMKYEVTYEDFIVFMNAVKLDANGLLNETSYIKLNAGCPIVLSDNQEFVFEANEGVLSPKCPVGYVTYEGATAFANWLGARLPTEAEWEYAARGGKNKSDYSYSGSNNLDTVAWYANNSQGLIHEVGLLQPNALGIYDMSGNVAEYCSDWYSDSYYIENIGDNPKGPKTGETKVVRGGSISDINWKCNVSGRSYAEPSIGYSTIGFRVVFKPNKKAK